MSNRKTRTLYLGVVGLANIGGWIYLLALNLIILEKTGSVLAVTGLYIIKPFASMLIGPWAGSVIDRVSTKHLMIFLDLLRALLVGSLLFVDSLWAIYVAVLFIQMAGAMFETSSFTYMTLLLPEEERNKFNALLSFVHSGAFVTGPFLAGILFMLAPLEFSLLVNIIIFICCGIWTSFLPNRLNATIEAKKHLDLKEVREDWLLVWKFSKKSLPFFLIYMTFQGTMLLTAALDSTEVAFAKEVLSLTDAAYGSLVSIGGVGFLLGAICTNLLVRFLSPKALMSVGTLLVASGYFIYSISTTYFVASLGFLILSFFLSIANTGYMTFIQSHIDSNMMGRISSLYEMASSFVQMIAVLLFGIFAGWISVKAVVIGGSLLMLIVSCYLLTVVWKFSNQKIIDNI
ncbi:MFS transporter [Psychrobacillus sp. Sa2BUA9]|uniref:MFS transporter n=1 Tax=Psychrobacillus faecigallinarum TaxID=2762235 RepID=A0ABR8R8J0_9BACI|nr:MFS transporter [Psychrobacillus faecigallinarum]MBD7944116.1 MFS transporter [Psychrobacillus faecigallinarum]